MRSFAHFAVFAWLSLILAGCTHKPTKPPPRVVDGVLDIRDWDFERDGPVRLDGDWEVLPEGILEGEAILGAPSSGDFVAVPWSEAHHTTRAGRDVDAYRWLSLRFRVQGAAPAATFIASLTENAAEALYAECRAASGQQTRLRAGIDKPSEATRYAIGLWPHGDLLVPGESACVFVVPRAVLSRTRFLSTPQLDRSDLAIRRARDSVWPHSVQLSVAGTLVFFAALLALTTRRDKVVRWSLAFSLLYCVRIVVVQRGDIFQLDSNAPLAALPWFQIEYVDLWLCALSFTRYAAALTERPIRGARIPTTILCGLAILALFASYEVDKRLLPLGEAAAVTSVALTIRELWSVPSSNAIRLARAGLIFGGFGSIGSAVSIQLVGYHSPLFEVIWASDPLFQMAILAVRAQDARKKSADLARATQHFVPTQFLHELGHEDVTTAKLGDAASRHVTVLFADIRNFTSLSERMSPAETFAFLNECLSRIGPHIRSNGGFVDKYIGDAIMALFPRDPSDAVRAAIAMQEEVRSTNARHPDRPPLAIGVGVHVGDVMMGTIGEAERFEATVISDAVNLTARLETLTKQLGCTLLLSGDAFRVLPDDLRTHTRRLGRFVVKGKAEAVELFECYASDAHPLRIAKDSSRDRLNELIASYTERDLERASAIAAELRDACPEDGPAGWWLVRILQESQSSAADDGGPSSAQGAVVLDAK